MGVKIAINGLGVLGRKILRMFLENGKFTDTIYSTDDIQLAGVNDRYPLSTAKYLLQHDTVYGKINNVSIEPVGEYPDEYLYMNGNTIPYHCYGFGAKKSDGTAYEWSDLPWSEIGAEVVIDCTGTSSLSLLQQHIQAGARYVIACEGSSLVDTSVARFVWGLNTGLYTSEHKISVCPSGDAIASTVLAKYLNDSYTIENGIFENIVSYTNLNNLQDSNLSKTEPQVGRAGAWNIIPRFSPISRTLGYVVPQLNGYTKSFEHRCGTIAGSHTDLIASLSKEFNQENFAAVLKNIASNGGSLGNVFKKQIPYLNYSDWSTLETSSDVIGDQGVTYNFNNVTCSSDPTFVRVGLSYDSIALQAVNAILMALYAGRDFTI